jgi:hypothetical protein
MDQNSNQPTVWDHIYFWTKEFVILVTLIIIITISLSAFFSLPEVSSTPELLKFILSS